MNDERVGFHKSARRAGGTAVALLAGALLVGGTAWHGVVSGMQPAPAPAAVSAPPAIAHPVGDGRSSYADVVKVVAPAVVTIRTEGRAKVAPTDFQGEDDLFRRFFGAPPDQDSPRRPRSFKQSGLGSGVIVTSDGYILTNYHVVDGADDLKVELTDNRTLSAKVVGSDKATDLALLKVDAKDLHSLSLGNSDAVQVGDVVLAVGNPLGIGQTVTMGIISAKGRHTAVSDGSYEDFLQTDAPINHGNSGGALVNANGELIGINSQILSTSDGNIGIGFAIPANMASNVMTQLRKGGAVQRAQLGVTVQPITSEMAESLGLKDTGGAIISAVSPGSAADRAGLKRGDVISKFNGQAIFDTNSLRNMVANAQPGSSAMVTIARDGSSREVTVKLDVASATKTARGDAEPDAANDKAALGVAVTPLTPELAARVGASKNAKGLLIEQVTPEGRAAEAGLQEGDVIVEVNRRPVQTVDELRTAVRSGSNRPLLLLVTREGQDRFMTVKGPSVG